MDFRSDSIQLSVEIEPALRISHFGRSNQNNLLYWNPNSRAGRKNWKLYGGHRIWTTRPGADENHETYEADRSANSETFQSSDSSKEKMVIFREQPSALSGISKELEVHRRSDGFRLYHRLVHCGDLLWSGGLWLLTCCKTDGFFSVPLGSGQPWDITNYVIPQQWAGQQSALNDPQFSFSEDSFVVHPQGRLAKRMIYSSQGIMINQQNSFDGDVFLVKTYFPDDTMTASALYPFSANLAFFVAADNSMVEMEAMGPMISLQPGYCIELIQDWLLISKSEFSQALSDFSECSAGEKAQLLNEKYFSDRPQSVYCYKR